MTRYRLLLLISGICFGSVPIASQVIYERTFPHAFPSIQYPLELSDRSTFSLGVKNECGGIGSRHIDAQGIELKDNQFSGEAFSSGYTWIGHDSILIWAEAGSYDVGPDSFRVYVWTPTDIRKILSVDIRENLFPDRQYGAFLYHPDRIVSRMTDTLSVWDISSGTSEVRKIIPGISLVLPFDRSILVFSDHELPQLFNADLEEIYSWENLQDLPFDVVSSIVIDSFLVGIDESNSLSLEIVNVFTESVSQLDLALYFDQVEEIQSNKNFLFVKGISNGEHQVLQLDHKFTYVDLKPLAFPDLDKPFTYTYYPDRVYAWSYDGIANYEANYRLSYRYQSADPIAYRDIGLDTMWVDSIFQYTQHYYIAYIAAVIRNHSSETIHSATIHYEEVPVFFCSPRVYAKSFGDLSIEPDDFDTVIFQVITYQVGSMFTRRFYLHHGNHHLDDQMADNSFDLVHMITSIDNPTSAAFTVYPNPFTNFIQLSSSSETLRLNLYDQTGLLVASGHVQLQGLGGLPPGVYFLQICSGTYHEVQRVVKVE